MRARVDGPHAEVIDALRQLGWAAVSTAVVGRGFPDLVAFHPRAGVRLVEVKAAKGEQHSSKATRARQARFASLFPTTVLRSRAEAQTWAQEAMRDNVQGRAANG